MYNHGQEWSKLQEEFRAGRIDKQMARERFVTHFGSDRLAYQFDGDKLQVPLSPPRPPNITHSDRCVAFWSRSPLPSLFTPSLPLVIVLIDVVEPGPVKDEHCG